jgi:hypothetical protein
MKNPKLILGALAGGACLIAGSASANTPLLENPDLSSLEGWMAGSNVFLGGEWQAYVTDAYTVDDRVDPAGDGHVFTSWDDGESDRIETYLLQEFNAGPVDSDWPTEFETGDVIVFKGTASSTKSGNDTSDMVVRAFIKTLGYNAQGWEFQTKAEYSDFHDIGSAEEPFELSITYPDITEDDSLQVIQLGLEITTEFDGDAMDSGTITFDDLEGYVEGDGGTTTWLGYEVDGQGYANTEGFMGFVNVLSAPWVWNVNMSKYVYIPDDTSPDAGGAWMYIGK